MLSDLIGVPFLKNGRDKKGIDCYGLVLEIYKRKGFNAPEYNSPEKASVIHSLIKDNISLVEELTKPEPYCMILLEVHIPYASHIGVVLDDCVRFIHADRKKGVVIEKLTDIYWRNKIVGFYKWKTFK